MPETTLIAEFKCPKCNRWWPRLIRKLFKQPEPTTVTKVAIQPYKDSGKIPQEAPVASRRVQVPLLQPTQVSLTIPILVGSYDNCLECGREYLVRAEVIIAPMTVKAMPGPGQNPFGDQDLLQGFGKG